MRPEQIHIEEKLEAATALPLELNLVEPMGADSLLWGNIGAETVSIRVGPDDNHRIGEKVDVYFQPSMASVFDEESRRPPLTAALSKKDKPPMPNYRISFQLYSARNFPPIEKHLETLAAIGYDAVEPYRRRLQGRPAGVPQQMRRARPEDPHLPHAARRPRRRPRRGDRHRQDPRPRNGDRAGGAAGPADARTSPAGRRSAPSSQEHAAALKGAGLKLAWHNHAFEYVTLSDGSRPIEHLLSGADVSWEPDIGWITRGGADIATELDQVQGQGRRLPYQGSWRRKASPRTTAGPTSAPAPSTDRRCGRRSRRRAPTSSSSSTTRRPTGRRSRATPTRSSPA